MQIGCRHCGAGTTQNSDHPPVRPLSASPQEVPMAKIGVTCLDCTADNPVQARAVLATVDLGEFHEPLGRLSWACLSCSHLVTTEVDVENLLRLLAAGVPLLDDDFGGSTLAEEYTDSAVPTQLHPRGPGRRRTVHSPGHLDSARAARDRGVGSSNSPNDRAAAHDRTPPTLDPSGDCLVPRRDLAGPGATWICPRRNPGSDTGADPDQGAHS